MFTVYTDGVYMRRLMKRLYSEDHYYLIHVDAAGASAEFTVRLFTQSILLVICRCSRLCSDSFDISTEGF